MNSRMLQSERRSAGFQTCCDADFQIGRARNVFWPRRFENLRYSRLGGLRYQLLVPGSNGCESLEAAA